MRYQKRTALVQLLSLFCLLSLSNMSIAQQTNSPANWTSQPIQSNREPTRFQINPIPVSESNASTQPTTTTEIRLPQESQIVSTSLQTGSNQQLQTKPANNIQSSSAATTSDGTSTQRDVSKLTKLPPSRKPELISSGSSMGGWKSLLTTVFALMVVLAAFMAFAMFTRRAWNVTKGTLPKQVFEVLGKTTYAPRQQMMVVRFGHKVLLVNHEQGNVQTLSEIDEPQEVDRIVGVFEQQSSNSISNSFGQVLSQVMHGSRDKEVLRKPVLGRLNPQAIVRKVA